MTTCGELIAALQQYDPNETVYILGHKPKPVVPVEEVENNDQ